MYVVSLYSLLILHNLDTFWMPFINMNHAKTLQIFCQTKAFNARFCRKIWQDNDLTKITLQTLHLIPANGERAEKRIGKIVRQAVKRCFFTANLVHNFAVKCGECGEIM